MIKHNVDVRGIQPEILLAIQEAREIYAEFRYFLTITSVRDGKHSKNSKHYEGLAVDLRTKHMNARDKKLIVTKLTKALGKQYDVVLEKTHLHVEFDPKE